MDRKPMKRSGRRSIWTYAKLTVGLVMLVGLNYVFNKLFDLMYGQHDIWTVLGLTLVIFIMLGFFIFYLWAADTHGTLAHMMGARDEDE